MPPFTLAHRGCVDCGTASWLVTLKIAS